MKAGCTAVSSDTRSARRFVFTNLSQTSRTTEWLSILGLDAATTQQTAPFVYTHEDMDKVETVPNIKCAPLKSVSAGRQLCTLL